MYNILSLVWRAGVAAPALSDVSDQTVFEKSYEYSTYSCNRFYKMVSIYGVVVT